MADLDFLDIAERGALERAATAIERGLGEKLRSVMLVGDGVPPVRREPAEPLDLLVVVSDLPVPALSNLAHQLGAVAVAAVRVRVLTERELLRSADVFTLQLADYQARNVVLRGACPLTDLHFTRGELRRSIEQTLRATGWRLRDIVLHQAGHRAAPLPEIGPLLREVLAELRVVAHHLLLLVGDSPPAAAAELLPSLGARVSGRREAFAAIETASRAEPSVPAAVPLLAELLEMLDATTAFVDEIGTGD